MSSIKNNSAKRAHHKRQFILENQNTFLKKSSKMINISKRYLVLHIYNEKIVFHTFWNIWTIFWSVAFLWVSLQYWFRLKCVFYDFFKEGKLTDSIFPPLNIFTSENRILFTNLILRIYLVHFEKTKFKPKDKQIVIPIVAFYSKPLISALTIKRDLQVIFYFLFQQIFFLFSFFAFKIC